MTPRTQSKPAESSQDARTREFSWLVFPGDIVRIEIREDRK
jgi:hypothetical protein